MKEKFATFLEKVKTFWVAMSKRRRGFIIAVFAIVVLVVVKSGGPNKDAIIETVTKKDLQHTVRASASVVSATDVSLGFDAAGTIQSMYVVVGNKVKKGDILARLDSADAKAAVTSAKGSLLLAQAKYKKVLDGSSNEEIAVAKAGLATAQTDLVQTKKTQDALVANAYKILLSDGLIAESVGDLAVAATPTISGTYIGEEGVYSIGAQGIDYVTIGGLENGVAKVSTTAPQMLGTRGLTIQFPTTTGIIGNTWKIKIPNKSGSRYTANNNTYLAAVNTHDQVIASAQSLVAQREADLALKQATARQSDIDSALAEVLTAQAGLESAQAKLEHTILRASADGTITSVDSKLGESVQTQKQVIVLQDVKNLYLEAKISESNIGSVAIGQSVTILYDALSGEEFHAVVSSIDPAAIATTDSTVSYKVKILLTDADTIRPGMSANISILTKEIKDALVIPKKFIQKKDMSTGVLLVTDAHKQKTVYKDVVVGLEGDGGFVEIKSGLVAYDKVFWAPTK
jgi:HlyD family secretion protein